MSLKIIIPTLSLTVLLSPMVEATNYQPLSIVVASNSSTVSSISSVKVTKKKKAKKRKNRWASCFNGAKGVREKAKKVDHFILGASKKYTVDNLIRAVIAVESCYQQRAVSPAGAQGLMQLIPATARRFGVSNSFDAKQNIYAGTKYLRFLLDRFGGSMEKAAAGYNAGEGKVDRYKGIPPYKETRNYVKKVIKIFNQLSSSSPSTNHRTISTQSNPALIVKKKKSSPSNVRIIQTATGIRIVRKQLPRTNPRIKTHHSKSRSRIPFFTRVTRVKSTHKRPKINHRQSKKSYRPHLKMAKAGKRGWRSNPFSVSKPGRGGWKSNRLKAPQLYKK